MSTITHVINSASIEGGHAINITVRLDRGAAQGFRIETHVAPNLAQEGRSGLNTTAASIPPVDEPAAGTCEQQRES